MIRIIDKIHQYVILTSLVVFNCVQAAAVNKEFTRDQYQGQWYDIGRISNCERIIEESCNFYEIDSDYYLSRIPIDYIDNCEYGFPIYTYFVPVELVNSTINVEGDDGMPAIRATIKSYNNGEEVILTDETTESCPSTSYRLWSRTRHVSAETKAEFDKLAGTRSATYFSWDLCPRLRSKTDEAFTLEQIKGTWYDIASVYYGDLDNDTCTESEAKIDYANQTLEYIVNPIRDGRPTEILYRGNIVDSIVNFETTNDKDGSIRSFTLTAVRCNNGEQIVVRADKMPHLALLSRKPKVPAEMMGEFERVSKNFEDAHLTFYPQDNCPNRIN